VACTNSESCAGSKIAACISTVGQGLRTFLATGLEKLNRSDRACWISFNVKCCLSQIQRAQTNNFTIGKGFEAAVGGSVDQIEGID
jgi:hypothetical protein